MPEISRFYGIIIFINYNDHSPPHFHARYGDFYCIFYINDEIIEGKMPARAVKMIKKWNILHKEELIKNWELAQMHEPMVLIMPLQ